MLLCVCSVIYLRRLLVGISLSLSGLCLTRATFLFSPCFDVICDLLCSKQIHGNMEFTYMYI